VSSPQFPPCSDEILNTTHKTKTALKPGKKLTYALNAAQTHSLATRNDLVGQKTPLTEREHEILSLLTHGLTDKDIAFNLTLEPTTVRSHMAQLCRKLCAINRVQLAVLAVRAGLGG